ncbi:MULTISPECIES: leucyl aminopeptidase [Arcobacteraceae]|uniref:Probable cytosol aminopeptidase n=1 Tax=Poseidonibacter parvus TaxID=1850254 RepID=A0A1P8KJT4_9BACT|nr:MULTISPECIES: leucyl aminopeptidase [Arcobacteraceae]APW64821.1 leucyl aminopeptidase [Poseidonibacter parvus]
MNIKLSKKELSNIDCDIELVVVKDLKKLEKKEQKLLKKVSFDLKSFDTFFDANKNKFYVSTLKLKKEDLKLCFSSAIRSIKKLNIKSVKFDLIQDEKELKIDEIVEGLILGAYEFTKYKSAKKKEKKLEITISTTNSKKDKDELQKQLDESLAVTASVNMVRNIINTPPEDYFPDTMANDAKNIASENGLQCIIQGEEYLLKNGMNAMYNVGRASRHESKLIHLSYKPKEPKGKIVLVGKGLTYDSGGLSLKVGGSMVSMKCDKGGGSAVLGIMNTLKALNFDYEVHGIIGAVENMIGGDAYKPDDVLVAKNGKTIEVRNTDAEGRLVLADCLCYAQDEIKDIDYIFDYATLTGAVVVALGNQMIGTMGHNDKLKDKMQKAANTSGELIGVLPFNRYLPKELKSSIADLVNSTNTRAAGSITAGLFLDNFIKKENKKKWLHLDIAGAAYTESPWGYNSFGATGAGVRLTLDFIRNLDK